MKKRTLSIGGAALAALLAVAAFASFATGNGPLGVGDDTDTPITGPALQRASDAAVAHTGEGRVSETEVGDEESLYEVEVTLRNGSQVDVQLDENFVVVGSEADSDSPGDEDDSSSR